MERKIFWKQIPSMETEKKGAMRSFSRCSSVGGCYWKCPSEQNFKVSSMIQKANFLLWKKAKMPNIPAILQRNLKEDWQC